MRIFTWIVALLLIGVVSAHDSTTLDTAPIDPCDQASLQRGAGVFMHYCQGCHSLQYMRYKSLAEGIGLKDSEDLIKSQLNFVSDKSVDPILSAIPKDHAEKWFGVAPPDLTLVARVRGKDWLYTYLRSFYADANRPWGVNNRLFASVAMPHVLLPLQGTQVPVYKTITVMEDGKPVEKSIVDHLRLEAPGQLSPAAYDQMVTDLVNFLSYVAEPVKQERQHLGVWVLLFLVLFLVFAWLLKREYWKDVQGGSHVRDDK